MNSSKVIAQIRKKIESAKVEALNQTADRVLDDLKANVPIKTGALNQSYQIQERPRKGRLRVVIGSPLFYARFQYILRGTYKKPRQFNPDRLFPPLVARTGVLTQKEIDMSKVEKLLNDNFSKAFDD